MKVENEVETVCADASTENTELSTPNRAMHSGADKRHLETPTSILDDICFKENTEGKCARKPKVDGLINLT